MPTLRGCYADDQCESGETCVFRLCNPACDAERRCEGDAQCVESGRGLTCIRVHDNACIDDSDCPRASECERGRCTNLCSPDAGMSCQPDFEGDASSGDAGGGGRGGAGGGGRGGSGGASPLTCPAGAIQCRDGAVVRCTNDGRAERIQSCPFVCNDGECAGSCRPDEVRCNGRARERCDASGSWDVVETCRNMCTPNACTETCMDGARECDGNAVTSCRGGRQFTIQRCDYLCRSGMCTGSCVPGARECRDNAVVTCSADGVWAAPMACPNACVDRACTGECEPGAQRCASNRSYQICNARGQWTGNVECRSGGCVDGECNGVCEPGATRCDSDTALATCGADGQWGGGVECPTQSCVEGSCRGSCDPGARRCLPNDALQPQVCDADGIWQNGERCATGQACVDGSCAGECIPTARRCDPADASNYQVCDAASLWGASTPCGDAMRCTGAGICETMLECPAGQSPEWWGMGDGVNRGLFDPRWGGPTETFVSGPDPAAAGYAIVFDRASNELAVTVRIEGADEPTAADFLYFGLANEDASAGRAARIEVAASNMGMGTDPRQLTSFDGYEITAGMWQQTTRPGWLERASGWLNTPDVSWAVSFRVDLEGVDLESPIRFAIGVHVDGDEELNWTTPTQLPLNPLMAQPQFWPTVSLSELGCAARVVLP